MMKNTDFEREIRNEIRKEIHLSLKKNTKVNNAKEKFSKLFVPIKNYLDSFQEIIAKNCYDIRVEYNSENVENDTLNRASIYLLTYKPLCVSIIFEVGCGYGDKSAAYSFHFEEQEGDSSNRRQLQEDYFDGKVSVLIEEEDEAIKFLQNFFKKFVANELYAKNIPNRQSSSLIYYNNFFQYLKTQDDKNLFDVSLCYGSLKIDINPKSANENFSVFIFPAYSGHPYKIAVSKNTFTALDKDNLKIELEKGPFIFKKHSHCDFKIYYELVGERLEHDIDIIQQICDLYEIFFKKQERRFDEEGNKIGFEWEIQFFELFLKHRSVLVYPLQSAMRFYESYAEILMKEFGENFQDKWLSYLQTFASHLTLDVKEYDDLMNEISALKNESSQKETDEDAPERSELIQKYSLFARYIRDNLGTNLTMTKKLIDNYHWWLENDFKDYNYEKLEKFISEKNILN